MAFWLATSALERRVHTDMWRHWRSDPDTDWDPFVVDLVQALQRFLLPDHRADKHDQGQGRSASVR